MILRTMPAVALALLLAACGSAASPGPSSTAPSSPVPSSPVPSSPVPSSSPLPPSSETGLPDDTLIIYAFQDSSVPPPYHRSVTLTVTKEQAHIVVDSYGDVLADETAATPAAAWAELGVTIGTLDGLTVADSAGGCTGGTSISLTVTSAGQDLVTLSPEFCAGANQDLEAPLAAWIAPARDLFPPTDELAPEGE